MMLDRLKDFKQTFLRRKIDYDSHKIIPRLLIIYDRDKKYFQFRKTSTFTKSVIAFQSMTQSEPCHNLNFE